MNRSGRLGPQVDRLVGTGSSFQHCLVKLTTCVAVAPRILNLPKCFFHNRDTGLVHVRLDRLVIQLGAEVV